MTLDNEATQKLVQWVKDKFGDQITVGPVTDDSGIEGPICFRHKSGKFNPLRIQAKALYEPDFYEIMDRCLLIWLRGITYYNKPHMLCSECNRDAIHFFTGHGYKMKHKCTDVREGVPCMWAFIDWAAKMSNKKEKEVDEAT